MNATETKQDYLLLIRGTDWYQALSPEEVKAVMQKTKDWFDKLNQQGHLKGTRPLGEAGRTVSGKNGRTVLDGPFAESKEAIGGYILLVADNLDEATAIAKGFPVLEYGSSIEVRPVAEKCSHVEGMEELFAQTAAM